MPVLLSCLNSFILDFTARRKVGGANLNQYIAKQLPLPKRTKFTELDLDGEPLHSRISTLVCQLVYNSFEMETLVEDLGITDSPHSYERPQGKERAEIRFELEALLCYAYGLDLADFDPVFDDFQGLKNQDIKEYGYYRTRDEIKKRFKELAPEITDTSEEDR